MLGAPKSDRGAVNAVYLYTMDADKGVLERQNLPKLGIGDPLQYFDVTGGRLVYFGVNGTTFSIDTDLRGPPLRLGPSLTFVPSTTEGRVWLEGPIRATADPERYMPIKEVTVDGEVVIEGRTGPACGGAIAAAVRRAVLCQASPPGMVAVDPEAGRRIGHVPGTFPLAASGDLIANCGEPCPKLNVSDPVAGRTVHIDPGPGFRWEAGYEGAFSPDGALIALPVVATEGAAEESETRSSVAVVDLNDRSADLIRGAQVRVGEALDFSSSGESLFFTAPDGVVMKYRPDDGSLRSIGSAKRIEVYDLVAN